MTNERKRVCMHEHTSVNATPEGPLARCHDCGTTVRAPCGVFPLPHLDDATRAHLQALGRKLAETSVAKPRPDLAPPDALIEIGKVLAWGLERPGLDPERWRTISDRKHLASAVRHVLEHLAGRTVDPETNLPHLAHAGTRVLYALARHLEDRGAS